MAQRLRKPSPGDRVGAIICEHPTEGVQFAGYGVFEGDFDAATDPHPPIAETLDIIRQSGSTINPRIKLDSGKTIWGAECWWGPEQHVFDRLGSMLQQGHKIVDIDIDARRALWRAELDAEQAAHDQAWRALVDAMCDGIETRALVLTGNPECPARIDRDVAAVVIKEVEQAQAEREHAKRQAAATTTVGQIVHTVES